MVWICYYINGIPQAPSIIKFLFLESERKGKGASVDNDLFIVATWHQPGTKMPPTACESPCGIPNNIATTKVILSSKRIIIKERIRVWAQHRYVHISMQRWSVEVGTDLTAVLHSLRQAGDDQVY